jgi:SAM-dependent methyltransferase
VAVCLEVGAGTGTVASWLAGAGARVTATDLDTQFLDGLDGVEVLRHDVTRDPLEPGAYDLVHARMLVEHLPARADVIARLVAALRPGGVLLLEDLLFGGTPTAIMEPATRPADFGPVMTRVCDAFAAGLRAAGAEPHFGIELPGALAAAGLRDVQAELTYRLLDGAGPGSAFYTYCLRVRGDQLVAAGLLTEDDMARATAASLDPAASWFTLGLVSAWGRRP